MEIQRIIIYNNLNPDIFNLGHVYYFNGKIKVTLHGFEFLVKLFAYFFNVPPKVKVIWGQGHSLKSHPTDWKSLGSNLQPLFYKDIG